MKRNPQRQTLTGYFNDKRCLIFADMILFSVDEIFCCLIKFAVEICSGLLDSTLFNCAQRLEYPSKVGISFSFVSEMVY